MDTSQILINTTHACSTGQFSHFIFQLFSYTRKLESLQRVLALPSSDIAESTGDDALAFHDYKHALIAEFKRQSREIYSSIQQVVADFKKLTSLNDTHDTFSYSDSLTITFEGNRTCSHRTFSRFVQNLFGCIDNINESDSGFIECTSILVERGLGFNTAFFYESALQEEHNRQVHGLQKSLVDLIVIFDRDTQPK